MTKTMVLNSVYNMNLSSRATTVVFYLINRANKELTCFPSMKRLAQECNISVRTAQRAIKDLIEVGLVKRENRFHQAGGQRSNLFTLHVVEDKEQEDKIDKKENRESEVKCKQTRQLLTDNEFESRIELFTLGQLSDEQEEKEENKSSDIYSEEMHRELPKVTNNKKVSVTSIDDEYISEKEDRREELIDYLQEDKKLYQILSEKMRARLKFLLQKVLLSPRL